MQAGLGGGSADAAAALQVLARLWGGAPLSLLREVAATVGSDAPFFLSGGTALGLGRGEEIYPLVDLAAPLGRHRPAAVRRVDRRGLHVVRRGPRRRGARAAQRAADPARALAVPGGADDQRPRAAGDAPPPGDWRDQGRAARSGRVAAAMSGSGSAVFGLFRTRPAAARAAAPAGARWRHAVVPEPHAVARRARDARPSDPAPRLTPAVRTRLNLTFSSGADGAGLANGVVELRLPELRGRSAAGVCEGPRVRSPPGQ